MRPTGGTRTTVGSPPAAPQGVCPTMSAPAPDTRGDGLSPHPGALYRHWLNASDMATLDRSPKYACNL